ncbi:MAG: ABC transporter permease [Candidatus Humimicrobiaceae bacterium]
MLHLCNKTNYKALKELLKQELRSVFNSKALWIMFLILCFLIGYSFIQAINLFGEASKTALKYPDLASGMNPLDGILVPTFGAFYLSNTLLLPFIAIRAIGNDKQSGTIKLLMQLPLNSLQIMTIKIVSLTICWLISFIPCLSTLVIWRVSGGHLYYPEVFNLLLGHALYALAIIAVSFFAASITDSSATAAIVALIIILSSWILDFAAGTQLGFIKKISNISFTPAIRAFEKGLFSSQKAFQFLITAAIFFALAAVWISLKDNFSRKIRYSSIAIVIAIILFFLSNTFIFYKDFSENRNNSFNRVDENALSQIEKPLHIVVYLSPNDSRFVDLDKNILSKLKRTVPKLVVDYPNIKSADLFGGKEDPNYGLIIYKYDNKEDKSYSNSENEILQIIYNLTGKKVLAEKSNPYPGYPIIINTKSSAIWFYMCLPIFYILAWWLSQNRVIKNRKYL